MPKLVGLQNVLTYILQAKQLKADKARKVGLVDQVSEDVDRFPGENRLYQTTFIFDWFDTLHAIFERERLLGNQILFLNTCI